jgi:hypothetical protein
MSVLQTKIKDADGLVMDDHVARRLLADHVSHPLDRFHWKSVSPYLHEIPRCIFHFRDWPIWSEIRHFLA